MTAPRDVERPEVTECVDFLRRLSAPQRARDVAQELGYAVGRVANYLRRARELDLVASDAGVDKVTWWRARGVDEYTARAYDASLPGDLPELLRAPSVFLIARNAGLDTLAAQL